MVTRKYVFPGQDYTREIAEFERIGEQELRYRLAHGTFYGDIVLAQEWIATQEREREDLRAESEISLAREANSLAREANSAARAANKRATIANVIAITAAIAAIASVAWDVIKLQ